MAARDVRKNINLFVDGRGMAGQIIEFNPPVMTLVTEEFRAGGMDVPVELTMGMEKLEASFSLIAYDRDVLALFGVTEGQFVQFIAREALESYNGAVTPVVHTMRGKIRSIDPGTSKPGDQPSLNIELALVYYKMQHGDTTVWEIDAENMVRVMNGVDALASQRAALGL